MIHTPVPSSQPRTPGRFAGTHPCNHRDPFDRLLAAQAICEQAALVTIDPAFAGFPDLSTLW